MEFGNYILSEEVDVPFFLFRYLFEGFMYYCLGDVCYCHVSNNKETPDKKKTHCW